MFLELILAGLVAHSAHTSANRAAAAAAASVIGAINESTMKLERHISIVEQKVDQLNIKIDTNQARLMRALTWHDYIQTLHVKGAKYKGDNLYVFKEKKTVTTANLATKEVKEVNGSFTLYKSFVEETEKLYADTHLVYEKFASGEIRVYDDNGRLYQKSIPGHETYTYLPSGKPQTIKWDDGSVWLYHYDKEGNVTSVESFDMKATSIKPVSQADVNKWRECAQKNSVPKCMNECNGRRGSSYWDSVRGTYRDNGCLNECQGKQYSVCGKKPEVNI